MAYYHRSIESAWLRATQHFPVLLLTGPRQVGKTTLLQQLCGKERAYVTLDDMAVRSLARRDPVLFLQQHPAPILIDEVQYAPELLPYIKIAVDQDHRPGAFWLTGSQQFHMMKGITESLAGRVAIVNLLGFSFGEVAAAPEGTDPTPFLPAAPGESNARSARAACRAEEVDCRIWRGGFPALETDRSMDRDLFYSSFVQTYLQRDVRDLTQVGDLETFTRFLRACAARTAQLLNYADLARDVDISVGTAKNWLSILQASFQVFLMNPFHSNVTKRLVKTPRLYFLDTGLCAYLTGWASQETLAHGAMAGAIFETYAVTEILKSWWFAIKSPLLYYYRDKDGKEIDLVICQDNRLYPIEIKRGASPRPDWCQHFSVLSKFSEQTGPGAVVCLAPQRTALSRNCVAVPVTEIG